MKHNATKERLLEMMVKLNPELIMEIAPVPPTSTPQMVQAAKTPPATPVAPAAPAAPVAPVAPVQSSAVQTYGKKLDAATALGAAGENINTMTKFKQTFTRWLPSLQFKPNNAQDTPENKGKVGVSKSTLMLYIGQALSEMGYK